jgi:hypothetical protein
MAIFSNRTGFPIGTVALEPKETLAHLHGSPHVSPDVHGKDPCQPNAQSRQSSPERVDSSFFAELG